MKTSLGVAVVLLLFLAGSILFSLGTGSVRLGYPQIFQKEHRAVFQIRLARTLMAVTVGAALSVAGVLFQAVLRNPLADPYVLGVDDEIRAHTHDLFHIRHTITAH